MLIMLIFFVPIYVLLIWSYKNPKESLLWGKRGMFKEEPELTEDVIAQTKRNALLGIGFVTFMLFLGWFAFTFLGNII